MKVLVACEFSGIIREAFKAKGHDAWSCGLLPTDIPGQHIQGDIMDVVDEPGWDLMIAHPPCTHLAVSGARWFKDKKDEQFEAIKFFEILMMSDIPKICLENPIGIMSTIYGKPKQIVQPWQFGHRETKATCLWLKNLQKLIPTNIINPPKNMTMEEKREWNKVHREPPGPNRAKNRSRTFQGIANAMAQQWG